jgi:hypothetical protein
MIINVVICLMFDFYQFINPEVHFKICFQKKMHTSHWIGTTLIIMHPKIQTIVKYILGWIE